MSTTIESIERSQMRANLPRFAAGDRVRVHFQVIEGTRRRTQVFEGIVISRQGSGARETFTVRKQSFGVGVERVFPLHSPKIETLEVAARGDVRRAKLYYLRDRVGKAARVTERRWGIDEKVVADAGEGAVDSEGVAQSEAEPDVSPEAEAAAEEAAKDASEGSAGSSEDSVDEQPASPEEDASADEAKAEAEETGEADETGETGEAQGEGEEPAADESAEREASS